MALARGEDGVHRDLYVAVGAILEADRHRQPRGELAVHLALDGARADRTPAHEVGEELPERRVEEFGARRQAELGKVGEELAREPQPFVDPVGAVEIRDR